MPLLLVLNRPLQPPRHLSSFVQFEDLARLLKVYRRIQEAVYVGEAVLVFPKEAANAAVIEMVSKLHSPIR